MLWGLSIFAAVMGVVATVCIFLFGRTSLGWNRTFQHAMLAVVISTFVALLGPSGDLAGGPFETIASAAYTFMQTASIQLAVGDMAAAAHEALSPFWATLYLTFLNLLAILTPLLIVSTAILELRKWFIKHRIQWHARHREAVYAFSGLSDNEVNLACDILEHASVSGSRYAGILGPHPEPHAKRNPLIVFCGVTDEVREECSSTIDDLQDQHRDDIVFTPASLLSIHEDLARFDSAHCFLFSRNRPKNVERAMKLFERVALVSARRAGPTDDDVIAFASRFHIYCLHDDVNDELTFDTIAQHVPDESEHDVDPARVMLAKETLEVRLFSDVEERIYGLLSRFPLFRAFDPAHLYERITVECDGKKRDEMVEVQQGVSIEGRRNLTVIVCGLGKMGLEALKGAYWFGRMKDVTLHVVGIDQEGDAIRAHLETTCPTMMEEKGPDGRHVVEVIQATAGEAAFDEALISSAANTFIYSIVTLGDDQLNLDVALHMRRIWERMRLRGDMDRRCLPIIAPLIYSEETFAAARNMVTDRGERYVLTPFGRAEEVFSFQEIVESAWERHAIAMNAAYDECWAPEGRGTVARMSFADTLRAYNKFEIKKLSNRTCTRHIPYRIWSAGLDPRAYFDERGELIGQGLPHDLWLRTMLGLGPDDPIDPIEVDGLFEGCFDGGSTQEAAQAAVEALRTRYPLLCELADIEHDRWAAFYASHGWRDLTPEEAEELKALGIIRRPGDHQSALMRMHCYLCDIDTLTERGIALGEDPYRYDRAAILEIARILSGEIFERA